MLCEINPLIVTPEGEVRALDSKFTVDDNALYKHPDIAEMRDLEAYPPEERAAREKGVTYVKLDGEVGILGNGAGLVDVDARRDRARRRPAGELLRPRRRRRRAGRRRRARGDQRRPAGALDPLQHLRRDHALRRRRARDPAGARADRRSSSRSSSASTARTPRRAARSWPRPRRRTCTSRRRCSTPPGAPWSWPREHLVWSRAEAYRRQRDAPRGRRPRPARRVVRAGEGVKALDVATGGGHVARRLRERARGGDARPVARGCGPTCSASAEDIPFEDGAFDVVVTRIAPHHFEDVARAVAEMERVSNRLVVSRTRSTRASGTSRPRSCATRRTCATTPRTSGASS